MFLNYYCKSVLSLIPRWPYEVVYFEIIGHHIFSDLIIAIYDINLIFSFDQVFII